MTDHYVRVLLKHMRRTPKAGVVHVEVRHDHGCAFLSDRPCDCQPEVESGARVDAKYTPPADDR